MKKKLRLNWLINSLIIILIVGGALMCLHFSRTVPWEKCSEVYKKYSRVEGVRATYVKDYRVNDTLTVGVTLLEATDSAGWEYLLEAFNEKKEVREVAEESTEKNKVWVRLAPKGHPEEKVGYGGQSGNNGVKEWDYDMLLKSYEKRAICVFDVNGMEEYMALIDYGGDIMTENNKKFISK